VELLKVVFFKQNLDLLSVFVSSELCSKETLTCGGCVGACGDVRAQNIVDELILRRLGVR
jgi:hypothetical protein